LGGLHAGEHRVHLALLGVGMALKLHRDMIAAAYDFLRRTEPFKAWRLPPSDDVRFRVVRDPKMLADFGMERGKPVIRISAVTVGHTDTLMATVAHEMIHFRQHLTGDREVHGARFKRMAAKVCAAHGYDPLTF